VHVLVGHPHVEDGRHPLKRFDESLQGCSVETRQRFPAHNFVDLMGARPPLMAC